MTKKEKKKKKKQRLAGRKWMFSDDGAMGDRRR
jgi:hypothetical protein